MKAIILAAGRGSRMRSLTDARPKCLTELNGKPLLQIQIDSLKQGGVDEVGIVVGYLADALAEWKLRTFKNERWRETNMVSSLACAVEWLSGEPCVVSYSDIFYSPTAVASLVASNARLAVTYDPAWRALWERRFGDPLLDAETFRLRADGKLAEIGKKPKTVDEIGGQYMGLLRMTPAGWGEIERSLGELSQADRDKIDMTSTLQRVIEAGRVEIEAIPYHGLWGEIDNPDDLALYQRPALHTG